MTPRKSALVLSPHLDDAVFSCGGTIMRLAEGGWSVTVATAFTASVLPATGFALACQLDKGFSPELDYMALRRDEDRRACAVLGASCLHLDLPEAPHRDYPSADALFAQVRDDDTTWQQLADHLRGIIQTMRPDIVFAPLALGGHVDHRQVVRSVLTMALRPAWYRDAPYAIRQPQAASDPCIQPLPQCHAIDITTTLPGKIAAACAYTSQIGFQFGGADRVAEELTAFAWREGKTFAAERIFYEAEEISETWRVLAREVSPILPCPSKPSASR